MTVQTAIWIPPSLCGCMLEMTAKWSDIIPSRKITFSDGTIKNMPVVLHKHPEQFSVTNIKIIHVCSKHKDCQAPSAERHMEKRPDGNTYQCRGTLRHHENVTFIPLNTLGQTFDAGNGAPVVDFSMDEHEAYGYKIAPIVNSELTEAEHLFEYLSQYTGHTNSYPCGCSRHAFFDEKGNKEFLDHPRLTRKCLAHIDDDREMSKAKFDHDSIVQAEKLLNEGADPVDTGTVYS